MKRTQKSQKRTKFLLLLIVLTAILSITATYAWFSTQRDVEIVGMKLNVEVAESLQISLDGKTWTQSIQIGNMRQFYGTYAGSGESYAIYQAAEVKADGSNTNTNYVPTELLPVSTVGTVVDGQLQFVTGTVGTSADGSSYLHTISACSEADITSSTSIENRESKNAEHPYLAFDMYLRNISAAEEGTTDTLIMNKESRVWVDTVNETQEGTGVADTGLEFSSRVGMVLFKNTLDVNATESGGTSIEEQVRQLAPSNDDSEQVAIWEPNHLHHTQYVVNNNGRSITATSQAVTTLGLETTAAGQQVNNINATSGDHLAEVNTFRPNYDLASGTTVATDITDINGTEFGLEPNKISKVRVYIWLEGQDPDCVDLASTGDKLNVTIKLTKDENTVTENTYKN